MMNVTLWERHDFASIAYGDVYSSLLAVECNTCHLSTRLFSNGIEVAICHNLAPCGLIHNILSYSITYTVYCYTRGAVEECEEKFDRKWHQIALKLSG